MLGNAKVKGHCSPPRAVRIERAVEGGELGLGTPPLLPSPHLPNREVLHPRTRTTPSFVPGFSLFQNSYVTLSPELAHGPLCKFQPTEPNSSFVMLLRLPHFPLQGVNASPCPCWLEQPHQSSHWLIADLQNILPHPWAEMLKTLLALGFAEVALLHLTFLWRGASSGCPVPTPVHCSLFSEVYFSFLPIVPPSSSLLLFSDEGLLI